MKIEKLFWALVLSFSFVLSQFFIPGVGDVFKGFIFLIPLIVFSLLGWGLVFLTLKKKVKGRLRKSLFLTGGSAGGFFVGVVLHNFFYALGILTEGILVLHYLFEFLHGAFFVLALLGCPLVFLIGAVKTILLLRKERKKD